MAKMSRGAREREIGRGVVEHVLAIATLVRQARDLLAEARKVEPRDATAITGHMAAELLEHGARLEDDNPHRLTWPWEERAIEDPTGLGAAAALVVACVGALRRTKGVPGRLGEAAAHWPQYATQGEAKLAAARSTTDPAPPPVVERQVRPPRMPPPSADYASPRRPPAGEWVDGEYVIEDIRGPGRVG